MIALAIGATSVSSGAQADKAPDQISLSKLAAVETEIERQIDTSAEVDFLSFEMKAEPWQSDPEALREAAASYKNPSPGVHHGTFDDGTTVRLIIEPAPASTAKTAASSNVPCSRSETAYPPSTPGASTRSTGAFTISSGCTSGDRGLTAAQSNVCQWPFGCTFQVQGDTGGVTVPNNGNTTYLTVFACRGGTHDWRTQSYFAITSPIYSSVRNLTNFC
jgi:hypothetical protein